MNGRGDQPGATILHISDTQFGQSHRFADGSLSETLVTDLRRVLENDVSGIDVIVISGDIAERGLRSEYDQARAFVDGLCAATGLDHDRVVTVPGNHDVSFAMCQAYFAECRAEETVPRPPYSRKWRHYQQFVTWLHGAAAFTEEQPFRVHRFGDLRLVVAALNSTIKESHQFGDHIGWCGTEQARWAADRLEEAKDCARVGVLHHNLRRRARAANENLNDEADVNRILTERVDLWLHGHTHDGAAGRLHDGTLVLATGAEAISPEWRPQVVPHQYQILGLAPGRLTRWTRRWNSATRQWVADTRTSPKGDGWRTEMPFDPPGWRESSSPDGPGDRGKRWAERADSDFVAQVEFVTRRDVGDGCPIERRRTSDGLQYLIVVRPAAPLRCVAVVDKPLDAEILDLFDEVVFEPLRQRGGAELVLVHHGPQAPELRRIGQRRGVRVKTWTEYNDLLDASAYRAWLQDELDRDQLYPQALYLPQRYREIDRWGTAGREVRDNLVDTIYDGVLEEQGQFFLILGDAGFGKSFLVRRLAHLVLDTSRAGVTPIVIYLRDRDKRQTIDEMVSNVMIGSRSTFHADHFQHSLQAGTIALLIDGYDEFAVRVGYHNAAAQLKTFIAALQGRAKILLTTRPNHFRSTDEATSALFESLRSVHHGSVYQLEPFDQDQQLAFLTRWFALTGGAGVDTGELASRWMAALARVDNLPELARTPRMLSFMARDLSIEAIEAAAGAGVVTAAALYQRLIDLWLSGEAGKVNPLDERNVSAGQRQRLLEEIALSLWQMGERDVTEEALQSAARDGLDLPRIEMTVDQAAQLIGGRTLLQVDARRWKFAHQSVWEFLLANSLARRLREGAGLDHMGDAQLTQLTIRFLRDLAPEQAAAWAARIAERGHA